MDGLAFDEESVGKSRILKREDLNLTCKSFDSRFGDGMEQRAIIKGIPNLAIVVAK